MAQVRATASAVVSVNGFPQTVREGQLFDTESDVVRQFAWLFESPVEEATAAPGERRRARKPPQ
jgi:hypothetical protein